MVFTVSGDVLIGKQYYSKGISEIEHTVLPSDLVTKRMLRGGELSIKNIIDQTYVFSKSLKLAWELGLPPLYRKCKLRKIGCSRSQCS